MTVPQKRVLLAGFGDLGGRVGRLLADQGCSVLASRRSPTKNEPGLESVAVDWANPNHTQLTGTFDACVVALTPDQRNEHEYRRTYLQAVTHLADALIGRTGENFRLLFISSTAVYGQDQGEWVDETSATHPRGFNGRILLEAENQVSERFSNSVCLRMSGLYGPGRMRMIQRARQGTLSTPPRYGNRIHIDDAARMIVHLLTREKTNRVYLGSDSEPALDSEVLGWLAGQLSVPWQLEPGNSVQPHGKRCRNERVLGSGFRFRYPGFREGYAQVLGALNQ